MKKSADGGATMVLRRVGATGAITLVGCSDMRGAYFEGQYPLNGRGMAYNSYVVRGAEATAVVDTADASVVDLWWEGLTEVLEGRAPAWLVVEHLEPDHTAGIRRLLEAFPGCQVACSGRAAAMMGAFGLGDVTTGRVQTMAENAVVDLGGDVTLRMMAAPMVHWPEVMVAYCRHEAAMFTSDAFGTFGATGATGGCAPADMAAGWMPEARRYYVNICGKYGAAVQALLRKVQAVEGPVEWVCPLHGPVLATGDGSLAPAVEAYGLWSRWKPDTAGALVAYATLHGATREAARIVYERLLAHDVPATMVDLTLTDPAQNVALAYSYSHLVLASPTYDGGLMPSVADFLARLSAKGWRDRHVALVENGSWAPAAARLSRALLQAMPGVKVDDQVITIRTLVTPAEAQALEALADRISAEIAVSGH